MNKYFELLRISHWPKNIVTLLGVYFSIYINNIHLESSLFISIIFALLLSCFLSSVNYIINQIVDVPSDLEHPIKKYRPIPSGLISVRSSIILAVLFFIQIFYLSIKVCNTKVTLMLLLFFMAGIIYNIKPIRLKDVPFIDVISESINNPIRFLIGWFSTGINTYPAILILFFLWTSGASLMTFKRYWELNNLDKKTAIKYRSSFRFYSKKSLLLLSFFWLCISFLIFLVLKR